MACWVAKGGPNHPSFGRGGNYCAIPMQIAANRGFGGITGKSANVQLGSTRCRRRKLQFARSRAGAPACIFKNGVRARGTLSGWSLPSKALM